MAFDWPDVDCAVHPILKSVDQLAPYLTETWQNRLGIGPGRAPGLAEPELYRVAVYRAEWDGEAAAVYA